MSGRESRIRVFAFIRPALVFFAVWLAVPAFADPVQDRRVQAGLRLFKAMLAADLDLDKRAAGGKLVVVFFHAGDPGAARALAERFQGDEAGGKIRELPVTVVIAGPGDLAALGDRKPAAVFVADPPADKALAGLIRLANERSFILYSPFEGHVERGVAGGISVEAQVRPYVNRAALEASRVRLKAFFLKVAKVYE